MNSFRRALETQRWDDHRYYHHSRINQSLHLLSAVSFLCTYVLLFTDPAAAALVGWLVAMVSRQVGHFYFEPKGYDEVNQATHEHKEEIKVGYKPQAQACTAGDLGTLTAGVWLTKILTDPFHDIKLYHTAPLYLLRGELIDPGPAKRHA